ncbi:MAG TPA: dephospho-CoA kinase [Anaeromyxobacter sp.]|nr:dephospho-CoA kinase [Anaeromyxobacter sp.]
MRVFGLTGGIASGKSTLAALLRERGAPVVDADVLSRTAVAPGSPTLARIVEAFGPAALSPDGSLDRRWLGSRVFTDAAERARLEAITHPAVRHLMLAEVARLEAAGHPLAFYDVPLLYEVGLEPSLDSVVVVWTPRSVQLERLVRRDGLSRVEADARLAAQMPLDEKAARADFVVENEGPPEALAAKADRLLADLRQGSGRKLPNHLPVRY